MSTVPLPHRAALRARLDELAAEVARFGPRSVPTELRTAHVLTAATLAFVTDGFEGASMERIAELAGVTKPVVYSLFGAKEELFARVIDRASEDLLDRLAKATMVADSSQLEPGIRAYLDYLQTSRDLWGLMLSSTRHEPVAAAASRLRDQQVELVAGALGNGYHNRGIEPDPREIEALAQLVAGAVESVGGWWLERGDLPIEAAVEFLVAALGPSLMAIRSDRAAARAFAGPSLTDRPNAA